MVSPAVTNGVAETVTEAPAKPPRRRQSTQRGAYAFLAPWLLGVAVLTIGPMVISLYLSFTDYDLFDPPHWIGPQNYIRMFTEDDHYWHAVSATIKYAVISVP